VPALSHEPVELSGLAAVAEAIGAPASRQAVSSNSP